MKENIRILKSSPMFNVSLSSKELFHSNFIAWLISEYPNEMWNILSKYTDLETEKYKIKNDTIYREHKHIDIMFDIVEINGDENKTTKIIIENKVKSLPYTEQLEKYGERFDNAKCILLTLTNPTHITKNKIVETKNKKWHILTYEELSEELSSTSFNYKKVKGIDDNEPTYHKQIINDYIIFISTLSSINKVTEIRDLKEKYNWYSEIFNELKEIRFADLYIKKKCENISQLIYKEIKELKLVEEEKMRVNSSIVNSTNGEFRFYYHFNNRVFVSIEVSEMYYRKLVCVNNHFKKDKKLIKYKTQFNAEKDVFHFFKKLDWFNFDKIPENKIDSTYKMTKEFNSFIDAKYKQCRLNTENTVEDIIGYFKQDFQFIVEKAKEITDKFPDESDN